MYKILSRPARFKKINFQSQEHQKIVWGRLKRHITQDELGKFRILAPHTETIYRGMIDNNQFEITRRNFSDRGRPTILGTLKKEGLLITMKASLELLILKIGIWVMLGSLAFQMLTSMQINSETLAYTIVIIGIPALIILIMQRWITNDRLYSEWKMLEDVLNHG